MKKLKENVDALQLGCQLCGGPHLDKECLLNKETKSVEEVKYGEFDRPFLNNSCINERLSGGVSGYGSRRFSDNEKQEIKRWKSVKGCSGLLQNQLPPKEQDPRSFILPCSIGRLDLNNALADLGVSISIMPFSMYKCLGMGKLKPINMVIKMADNTKLFLKE
ncbi:hypothetical protein Tco_0269203 [Tanacetum coccineum]